MVKSVINQQFIVHWPLSTPQKQLQHKLDVILKQIEGSPEYIDPLSRLYGSFPHRAKQMGCQVCLLFHVAMVSLAQDRNRGPLKVGTPLS